MAEYIERTVVFEQFDNADADVCETDDFGGVDYGFGMKNIKELINAIPAADVVPVVRCHDCINAEPLERNCELNANLYMHCRLWRGEECKNVWHKYKRYYRDYSLVEHGDFCSNGERKDGGEHVE